MTHVDINYRVFPETGELALIELGVRRMVDELLKGNIDEARNIFRAQVSDKLDGILKTYDANISDFEVLVDQAAESETGEIHICDDSFGITLGKIKTEVQKLEDALNKSTED